MNEKELKMNETELKKQEVPSPPTSQQQQKPIVITNEYINNLVIEIQDKIFMLRSLTQLMIKQLENNQREKTIN